MWSLLFLTHISSWYWPLLVSQTTTVPTDSVGPALASLGIGVLVALPAYAALWGLWKWARIQIDKKDIEIKALQLARVQDLQDQNNRDRELADRLGPLLAEAVKISSVVPERITQALNQASTSRSTGEANELVRRLEDIVQHIPRDRGSG